MLRIVIHTVGGDGPAPVLVERLAGIRIDVESREVAARYVDADAVPTFEDERGRIHLDRELVNLSRLHQLRFLQRIAIARTDDGIRYIEIDTGRKVVVRRININQLRGEVRVERTRR